MILQKNIKKYLFHSAEHCPGFIGRKFRLEEYLAYTTEETEKMKVQEYARGLVPLKKELKLLRWT